MPCNNEGNNYDLKIPSVNSSFLNPKAGNKTSYQKKYEAVEKQTSH